MHTPHLHPNRRLSSPVTLILITCMLLATLPALSFPRAGRILSAGSATPYPWQSFTAAFTHGWAFLPPLLHLAANLSLFFFVGPLTERLLGSARFLLVMLAAILAASLVRGLPAFPPGGAPAPSGASAFILACGPILLYDWMAIRNSQSVPAFQRLWIGLLTLALLLGAPLIYGTWLARQSSSPLPAFLAANTVHLSAFLIGGLAAALWRDRLSEPAALNPDRLDRAAAVAAALLPAAISVLILLGALRMI